MATKPPRRCLFVPTRLAFRGDRPFAASHPREGSCPWASQRFARKYARASGGRPVLGGASGTARRQPRPKRRAGRRRRGQQNKGSDAPLGEKEADLLKVTAIFGPAYRTEKELTDRRQQKNRNFLSEKKMPHLARAGCYKRE